MPTSLRYDPEYLAWRSAQNLGPPPRFANVFDLREYVNRRMTAVHAQYPLHSRVEQKHYSVTSYDGAQISVVRFATASHYDQDSAQPAIVYGFGGGTVSGSVQIFAPEIADYVAESCVQFFAVGYRLAPEHPAPTAVEDFFAAVKWLSECAKELSVDAERIGVMGNSAGGGIAAGAALLARDRKLLPQVAKQILIYPMLDDRSLSRVTSDSPLTPFLTWNWEESHLCWVAYLGGTRTANPEEDVSPYAVPARHKSLAGLPSTYIDIGNLDLFRDEVMDYVARMAAENIDVEFHLIPGVPHTFDYAFSTSKAREAKRARVKALQSF
ncbi:uncharacterized protein NECHADRAFT_56005 [Fusarium vanettenii 77-13-4]|uniref:Alpha/beta hydrolase fold-3 domain-containing protein n=1 Tax=Fusarium vanettenii (strain ATCC MYA-4622 / CBS 123669 / FGSC 9596 / NRRL 45880 / 77-13-4) TaxID=660122 RepID=C7ZQ88_FUSV7|nr:uncharacterized protein NECHADRAFT_56005 [Fusarium vanettenii 77-13-4]EEU33816.1 hypothetical protein NECHADRAFT_56005 [Fusarium vanettenii 77-13-4]